MRRNFDVGAQAVGAFQQLARLRQVAHAVLDPAQAVGDEGVVGSQAQRTLDQELGFFELQAASASE